MDEGLYTVAEAAAAWGISKQAVYQRLNKLNKELEQAKAELLAEQGKTSTLQATVTAQEAHIETLKQALEKEQTNTEGLRKALDQQQALHLATMQQRLPAGRGEGLFSRFRRKTKGTK